NEFYAPIRRDNLTTDYATAAGGVLNRFRFESKQERCQHRPLNCDNRLIHLPSKLGKEVTSGSNKISFFQLEPNPMFPGEFFCGLGRHFIFSMFPGLETSRLVIEMTTTPLKQFDCVLPRPRIIGMSRSELDSVGRGSA